MNCELLTARASVRNANVDRGPTRGHAHLALVVVSEAVGSADGRVDSQTDLGTDALGLAADGMRLAARVVPARRLLARACKKRRTVVMNEWRR